MKTWLFPVDSIDIPSSGCFYKAALAAVMRRRSFRERRMLIPRDMKAEIARGTRGAQTTSRSGIFVRIYIINCSILNGIIHRMWYTINWGELCPALFHFSFFLFFFFLSFAPLLYIPSIQPNGQPSFPRRGSTASAIHLRLM